MDRLSRDDLRALLANRETPCVSLYMPTTRGVGHEDKKRWKNLVGEAEDRLIAAGRRGSDARDLLRPARELLDNIPFWQNVGSGLAGFFAPEVERLYRLPTAFDELATVGDRFHIKPLLPLFAADGPFYILALSQNKVRLLHGTRDTIEEFELQGMPKSFDEALRYDDVEIARTVHSHQAAGGKAGTREAISQGHGAGVDSAKDGLLEFAQRVARGLQRMLHEEVAPLVLAGVEFVVSIYRKANTYPHVLAGTIEGNADRLSARELHDRAWAIVRPHFEEARDKAIALYRQLAGTGRTTGEVGRVVAAAYRGELEFLFVALGKEQWGKFEPFDQAVEIHERPEPGDEDLLNLAAVYTLSHKGTVYAVETNQVPEGGPVAAIFWLPLKERGGARRG